MIQGLQVDVKSAELKSILEGRVEYHSSKAKAYEEQSLKLRATMKNIEEDMEVGKVSNGDPAQSMDQKAREHKDKAVHFQFMIDHVIQDDIYRLGQNDLSLLGISPVRGFY